MPVAWEGKVDMNSIVVRFLALGASNHNGRP